MSPEVTRAQNEVTVESYFMSLIDRHPVIDKISSLL